MTKKLTELRQAQRTGLSGQRWLIYGAPKIGKSTFAASAPDHPIFLDCEYGLGFLDAYVLPCTSWANVVEAISTINRGGHDHGTVVIDTIDRYLALATEHVQRTLGIEHIGDASFGRGYGRLRELVDSTLYSLASHGRLVLLISHDKTDHTEGKPDVVRPSVARTQQILGYCDVIGRVEQDEAGQRRIRFRSSAGVVAGARGRAGQPILPAVLPLSWEAIQEHLRRPPTTTTTPTTTPKDNK